MRLLQKSKAQVAQVVGGLITGVVMLFIGLFMVDIVSNVTALQTVNGSSSGCWAPANCTLSVFANVETNLITTTSTIFTVLGLVIIVIALAAAIGSLRGVTA